jgi:hypothetical protein
VVLFSTRETLWMHPSAALVTSWNSFRVDSSPMSISSGKRLRVFAPPAPLPARIGSVNDFVSRILFSSSPRKIGKSIVSGITVRKVPALHPRRPRPNECRQH